MANHSSAQKALRQTKKKNYINKNRVSRIRTYVKKAQVAIQNNSLKEASEAFIIAQSELMKGVSRNVIKLNTASRTISNLACKIKKLS